MRDIKIQRAEESDFPYIQEKLKKYILDVTNARWQNFFVGKLKDKTVAFGRIIDHKDYFEVASLGTDYYYRKQGIGTKMLTFLAKEAKRLDPEKPVYLVTHIPGFAKKSSFKEVTTGPKELEEKKRNKCKYDPLNSKIMKFVH